MAVNCVLLCESLSVDSAVTLWDPRPSSSTYFYSNLNLLSILDSPEWLLIICCNGLHQENHIFKHWINHDKPSNKSHLRWLPRHFWKFSDCSSTFSSHSGLSPQLRHCYLTPLPSSKGGSSLSISTLTSLLVTLSKLPSFCLPVFSKFFYNYQTLSL